MVYPEDRRVYPELSRMAEVCPVCQGRGLVPGGFYSLGDSSSTAFEQCRSCGGKGYIIVKVTEPIEQIKEGPALSRAEGPALAHVERIGAKSERPPLPKRPAKSGTELLAEGSLEW